MNILEILEAHTVKRPWSEASRMRCKCGETVTAETEGQLYALHRAHVALVLEQHEREAKAEALEEAAHAIASAEINLEIFEGQDHLKELWAHSNQTRVGIVTSLRERAAQIKATP